MPVAVVDLAPMLSIPMTVEKLGSVPTPLETHRLASVRLYHSAFRKHHLLVTCHSPWPQGQAADICSSIATTAERIGTIRLKQAR